MRGSSSSRFRTAISSSSRPATAKRTALAALRASPWRWSDEGLITKEEAVRDRVPAEQLRHSTICCTRIFDRNRPSVPTPSPEAASRPRRAPPSGRPSSTPRRGRGSERQAWRAGHPRARPRHPPRISVGCTSREGILTARGGMTSHAAVVARGMGQVLRCTGCSRSDHRFDEEAGVFRTASATATLSSVAIGSASTASLGHVHPGDPAHDLLESQLENEHYTRFMSSGSTSIAGRWPCPHERRHPRGQRNAPGTFGAEGIGLTRTEHMFFGPDRIASPCGSTGDSLRERPSSENGGAGPAVADAAQGFHRASSRRWTACP